MNKLRLQVESIQVVSFEPSENVVHAPAKTPECTLGEECVVTGGINSCWCTEYPTCSYTCDCV